MTTLVIAWIGGFPGADRIEVDPDVLREIFEVIQGLEATGEVPVPSDPRNRISQRPLLGNIDLLGSRKLRYLRNEQVVADVILW